MFRSLIDTVPARYMVVWLGKRGWSLSDTDGTFPYSDLASMEAADRLAARLNRGECA